MCVPRSLSVLLSKVLFYNWGYCLDNRSLVAKAGALEEIAGVLTRHSISPEVW